MTDNFRIAGQSIPLNSRVTLNLPIPQLYTHTPMDMPVHVVRGKRDGPTLFVSAAIHGDELNGVEIIRRLMNQSTLNRLSGTLITIPIVNVYGVIHGSRYLPDRRDLNRVFPGSVKGSLASRLAHLLVNEVISKATLVVDLHTGAVHRSNLPQIRANMENDRIRELANTFGAPVIVHSESRKGSLRAALGELDIPIVVYEAGEALRFDEICIRTGLRGINNIMQACDMLPKRRRRKTAARNPLLAKSSSWVRSPISGVLLNNTKLGESVKKGDMLAAVADPFSSTETPVLAPMSGLVIGRTHLPLVNEGDAVIHIAQFTDVLAAGSHVSDFQDNQQQAIEDDDDLSIV